MPRVTLAPPIARNLAATPGPMGGERSFELNGETVRDLLEALFADYPNLRGYLLDDQGALRHHVVAFVNGAAVRDKRALDDHVPPEGDLFVFQALSGG
jgi:sulfur carrier protein ThiS